MTRIEYKELIAKIKKGSIEFFDEVEMINTRAKILIELDQLENDNFSIKNFKKLELINGFMISLCLDFKKDYTNFQNNFMQMLY